MFPSPSLIFISISMRRNKREGQANQLLFNVMTASHLRQRTGSLGIYYQFVKGGFKVPCRFRDLCYVRSPHPWPGEGSAHYIPEEGRPTFDAGSHRGHVDNGARFLSEHLSKQNKNATLQGRKAASLKGAFTKGLQNHFVTYYH